ncbi:hypothetical protein HZA96_06420 [Candidatus Woesearchaeota archaeon]|nr:hypothetical protein [Candidatus Woesearchaeota archaeon]
MVEDRLTRTVLVQAIYRGIANKTKQEEQRIFDLDGFMRIRSRSNRRVSATFQLSGVDDGLEYCTVLSFRAVKYEGSLSLEKPIESADFKNTVYNKAGKWSLRSKDIDAKNNLFYKNLCAIINGDLDNILDDNSSANKSLAELLERKYIQFGETHLSSGFPTDYLDSLLRTYQSQEEHGIVLTKAKSYAVQFKQEERKTVRDKFSIGDFTSAVGVLDGCIVLPGYYGRGAYYRREL